MHEHYTTFHKTFRQIHKTLHNSATIVHHFYNKKEYTTIQIPHRRDSTFISLQHEENGFQNNAWKQKATRYNQLKFQNEVSKGHINTNEDGLNDCYFTEHSRTKVNKFTSGRRSSNDNSCLRLCR